MKNKSIFRDLILLFAGAALTVIGTIIAQRTEFRNEKKLYEENRIKMLKVARNEISFYCGLYKQSKNELKGFEDLAKNKSILNVGLFNKIVDTELLKRCKIELINFGVNDTVIRVISGCNYDLEHFDYVNKMKAKYFAENEKGSINDLENEIKIYSHNLNNYIDRSHEAYKIISNEINRLE